jgi:hypothetical protein
LATKDNRRRDELNALSDLLRRTEGRQYIWSFLAGCSIYQTSFGGDALAMAFREGERNTGLRLLADCIEANSDAYLAMIKEHAPKPTPVEEPEE